MAKQRAVFDTNVLISALIAPHESPPQKLYKALRRQEFILLTSNQILGEVTKILRRSKIARNYNVSTERRKIFMQEMHEISVIVPRPPRILVISEDPTDNKFLGVALKGKTNYIVSGDKHLLNLKKLRKYPHPHPAPVFRSAKKVKTPALKESWGSGSGASNLRADLP